MHDFTIFNSRFLLSDTLTNIRKMFSSLRLLTLSHTFRKWIGLQTKRNEANVQRLLMYWCQYAGRLYAFQANIKPIHCNEFTAIQSHSMPLYTGVRMDWCVLTFRHCYRCAQ